MSALSDHGRALLILHRIGHMPGAAVLLMDDPEVAREVRAVTEWVDGLRLSTTWPVSAPDVEARCAALSAEFAAEAAATSDGGWG